MFSGSADQSGVINARDPAHPVIKRGYAASPLFLYPQRVSLACHLWMPAGGVTMKMAVAGVPTGSREKM